MSLQIRKRRVLVKKKKKVSEVFPGRFMVESLSSMNTEIF